MPDDLKVTLAIFASDKGPGDAERASLMSQAGALLAKRGAKLITLSDRNTLPLPTLNSARAAGGEIEIFAADDDVLPNALRSVNVSRISDKQERLRTFTQRADCFVALPGSLASITNLFYSTLNIGAQKPVIFLNHHNAFEIMRGFVVDVLAHGNPRAERNIMFADNIDDLWNKIARSIGR